MGYETGATSGPPGTESTREWYTMYTTLSEDLRMRLLVALTLVTAAACGDSTAPTVASVAGTWTLKTVNGAALPATISGSGTNRTDVTGGTTTMTAAGAYSQSVSLATVVSGQTTTSTLNDVGTFAVSGSTITFTSANSGSTNAVQTATLKDNTFSVSFQGYALIFSSQ